MKKIGIITFAYSNNNYGQLLQAYALMQFIKDQGYDSYLIDYRPDPWLELNRHQNIIVAYLKYFFKRFLNVFHVRKRKIETALDKRNFDLFRKQYLEYSPNVYYTYHDLKKNPPTADIFITGSDQVWAPRISDVSPYMLAFAKGCVKIAYAASFGGFSIPMAERQYIHKLLSEYQQIGMRELSGVETCKDLGLNNVVFTPDPTMLITPEQWLKIASPESPYSGNKKKIFVYSCYLPKGKLLDTIPQKENYEIIVVDIKNEDKDSAMLTIPQWLAAIRDADYVITNSFHATMFSLYFNTSFLTFKYDASKMNSRLTTIEKFVSVSDRIIGFGQASEMFDLLQTAIDWNTVNLELDKLRDVGVEFLHNNLS